MNTLKVWGTALSLHRFYFREVNQNAKRRGNYQNETRMGCNDSSAFLTNWNEKELRKG